MNITDYILIAVITSIAVRLVYLKYANRKIDEVKTIVLEIKLDAEKFKEDLAKLKERLSVSVKEIEDSLKRNTTIKKSDL